jgi:hypothetical protein
MAPPIRVSSQRRTHILDGDATGGGHGPGRQKPGKSEFPSHLTDDEIIDGVEVIANDPMSYPAGAVPVGGSRVIVEGEINGVRTRLIVDPALREVVTAYPPDEPRNL